ncbi:MAG: chorismate synthase [Deltaproteobacteria bacterium]|nr:chorismate synthase [Deltaproteobacteria bacterium]
MSGSSFGTLFKISTFGESHGKGVGVIIDGVTPGIEIDEADIQFQLNRRKPGQSDITTPRKESDQIHILSGVFEGKTTGTPMGLILYNEDQKSSDYNAIKDLFRPGHADFTYLQKYGIRDHKGSGRASGRETAARVAAGAVAMKILKEKGVQITAYTIKAAGISCEDRDLAGIEKNKMRACDSQAAEKMEQKIRALAEEGDSAGGIIECIATGVAPGLGEPVFEKIDAELARAVMSLGAVKAVEFGAGFACVDMKGSEHNDSMDSRGFKTNNAGGMIGGITTGEDIIFRIAVKPTSSISKVQNTVNVAGEEKAIRTEGRHDPCICPRIVPVVEAMTALVLIDMYKREAALLS